MDENTEETAMSLKMLLLSENKNSEKEAVDYIKNKLETTNDHEFVNIILKTDILDFLLERLVSLNYSIMQDILMILEQLFYYKIFYSKNYISKTTDSILHSIIFLMKDEKRTKMLVNTLFFLAHLFKRLDCCSSNKNIKFEKILDGIRDVISLKQHPEVHISTVYIIQSIISSKFINNQLTNRFLTKLFQLFKSILEYLSKIKNNYENEAVKTICDICSQFLQFFKNDPQHTTTLIQYVDTSLNAVHSTCLPYIAALNFSQDHMELYTEFLTLIKTLYSCDLDEVQTVNISQNLLDNNIFKLYTEYMKYTDSNNEEHGAIRDYCIDILCDIMTSLSMDNLPNEWTYVTFKKYLYDGLKYTQTVRSEHSKDVYLWKLYLGKYNIATQTNQAVIMFYSYLLIHSKNLSTIKTSDLFYIIRYLKYTRRPIYYLPAPILRNLWLLYAVLFTLNTETNECDGTIYASKALQRFVFLVDSVESVLPFHPAVLIWSYHCPTVKKDLQVIITNYWLVKASQNPVYIALLMHFATLYPKARFLLFHSVQTGDATCALLATKVLQLLLSKKYLKKDLNFTDCICTSIPLSLNNFSKESIPKKVGNFIYAINLAIEALPESPDYEILEYNVQSFINTLSKIGLSEKLPEEYFCQTMTYINRILNISRKDDKVEILNAFMTSERFLYTIVKYLMSDIEYLSHLASVFLENILEYQIQFQVYNRSTINVHHNVIIKLLSVNNNDHLVQNLNLIYYIVKSYNMNPILKFWITDEKFLVALYATFCNLVYKPGLQDFTKICFKCLYHILRCAFNYTANRNIHYKLICYPANHTLIFMQRDKNTARVLDKYYLNWILCLLKGVKKNDFVIFTCLFNNSEFWKKSLIRIIIQLIQMPRAVAYQNYKICINIIIMLNFFVDLLPPYYIKKLHKTFNYEQNL